jgi:hypothetical protein
MSQAPIQAKTCIQCSGYDPTKTGCYYKPYEYFWGFATLVQVEPTDPACSRFKFVELPY